MSKEVKRYDCTDGGALFCQGCYTMSECEFGEYVSWDDYEALLAERDALKKDAERYRWLRMADWWNSPLCVIRDPKQQAKPGADCPSRDRLDEAIDAALQGEQP